MRRATHTESVLNQRVRACADGGVDVLRWSDMSLRLHTLIVQASSNSALEAALAFFSHTPMAGARALTIQGVIPELETAFIRRARSDRVDCPLVTAR